MSKASRLGIYSDVREVADLALAHGGGSYDCIDRGMAQNFAHRFYRFRKLFREIHHADGSPCKYDALVLPRVSEATVSFHLRQHQGTFRPHQRVNVATALAPDEDLFDIAQQLAAKIKGDI